jgi:hypothetical protein
VCVQSRMLPFAFAGSAPGSIGTSPSLLDVIVKSNRPSLCGNLTVRTLVQYKWQTFGRELFMRLMGFYCLELLLLMTLLFVRPDPLQELTANDLLHGDPRDKTSFAVTLIVLLESLFVLLRKCLDMSSVISPKNYLVENWKNSVELTVILLM